MRNQKEGWLIKGVGELYVFKVCAKKGDRKLKGFRPMTPFIFPVFVHFSSKIFLSTPRLRSEDNRSLLSQERSLTPPLFIPSCTVHISATGKDPTRLKTRPEEPGLDHTRLLLLKSSHTTPRNIK